MKKALLLSLVVCISSWLSLQAQTTFQRTSGNQSGTIIPYDITPTNDGGFATTGFSTAGNTLFQAILLTKTDEGGATQWAKIFGGSNFEVGQSIAETTDNGFIIGGKSLSFGGTFEDAFLSKTDANGNLIWTKAYGGDDADQVNSVFQASDGGYTFIGESQSFSTNITRTDAYVVHTDANGEIVWSKSYNSDLDISRVAGTMRSNGGYAFTGIAQFIAPPTTELGFSEPIQRIGMPNKPWLKNKGKNSEGGTVQTGILLVELDANGNITEEKLFGVAGNVDCFGTSIIASNDGGYIIGGYTIELVTSGINFHLTALKIHPNGTIQWSENFQTFDSFFNVDVSQLSSGHYALTGTNSSDPGTDSQIVTHIIGNNGGLIESHQYGSDTGLNAARATLPSVNGVLIAGQSNSFGTGTGFTPLGSYLIQTDGFGGSGCNDNAFSPLQFDYTYAEFDINLTATNNGTSHMPTVETEDLMLEDNHLCGFVPPSSSTVAGLIWWDKNKDGIRQMDEPPLGNIGINLHRASDFFLVDNIFSESDGTYSFDIDNADVNYYLVFGGAPLFSYTLPNVGDDDSIDSDVTGNIGSGSTDVFDIDDNQTLQVDAGILGAGSVSGFVWRDDNGDGQFTDEEGNGSDGVQLQLIFNNGTFSNVPFMTTTENGGTFTFDNLLLGEAVVEVVNIDGTSIQNGTLTTSNNPTNPFNINMNQLAIEDVNFGFQVPLCHIEVLSATAGVCNPDDNIYPVEVVINYENAPDGNIDINIGSNFATFTSDGSGQETFILGLIADGASDLDVSANFANDPNCSSTLAAAFDAPESCELNCMVDILEVVAGDCDPATNTYTLEVTVAYEDAPNGSLNISVLGGDFPFTPDSSGQETFSMVLPTTETENAVVRVFFMENADCHDTMEDAYDEPTSCEPICSIEITDVVVSDCDEDSNTYTVDISVAYENAPDGDVIISLLGQDFPIPSNGSSAETYSLELTAVGVQNVEITASFDENPDCSTTLINAYNEPEPCISDCPTSVTATATATEICSGDVISLKAVIDNLNFILVWTDENGETFDHNNVELLNETCTPISYTFTAYVSCSTNPNITFEDQIKITVYPSNISAFATPVEGTCTATVTMDDSCGDNVAVTPYEAEPNTSGLGFVTLTWVGEGDCIEEALIPVAYNCAGIIDAVNDNLGNFSIGETVTFTPSQILGNDSGNNISLIEICETSSNGGTIVNNGNGTYTYTPPTSNFVGTDTFCYSITDSEGNTDEAIISVTYGDLKFTTDITFTCDQSEGTYLLLLTIDGSTSNYEVEVIFPEPQAPITVSQNFVPPLGPFPLSSPNFSIKVTQLSTGGSRIIEGVADCTTLPIELVSFEGEVLNDANLLEWVTASEVNNDFFHLQRSLEGIYFETIHTVDGAGTTSTTTTYSFMDRDIVTGMAYYRLEQTDFDGSTSTSKVIALNRGEMTDKFDIISVTPLGDYQHTAIGFYAPQSKEVEAKLYDVSGRLVLQSDMEANQGFNTLQINTSAYTQGVYLLQLQYSEEMKTVKILR